jgi:hypothetical protein
MKSDCSQITAAAPTNPCNNKKKNERKDRNLVSLMCPITFQDQIDKISTKKPTKPETSL